jgi:hypothetical protein
MPFGSGDARAAGEVRCFGDSRRQRSLHWNLSWIQRNPALHYEIGRPSSIGFGESIRIVVGIAVAAKIGGSIVLTLSGSAEEASNLDRNSAAA